MKMFFQSIKDCKKWLEYGKFSIHCTLFFVLVIMKTIIGKNSGLDIHSYVYKISYEYTLYKIIFVL